MAYRQPSPTPSENEFDIAGSLFANDFDGFGSGSDDDADDKKSRKRKKIAAPQDDELDLGSILEGSGLGGSKTTGAAGKGARGPLATKNGRDGDEGDDDDGDAAYIALQQAAAFRSSANTKGTSSVKGGGFQAMGMFCCLPSRNSCHTNDTPD